LAHSGPSVSRGRGRPAGVSERPAADWRKPFDGKVLAAIDS